MAFVPAFVVKILAVAGGTGANPGKMLLVVRRPYAHLEDRLRRAFGGRDDVEVIADRRHGERRMSDRRVSAERRRAERRTRKDEIVEVIIQGDPLTLFQ